MTNKKVAADSTKVKEAPFWELMGYSAEEWQGYLYTNRINNPAYELAPFEADFSDFVG